MRLEPTCAAPTRVHLVSDCEDAELLGSVVRAGLERTTDQTRGSTAETSEDDHFRSQGHAARQGLGTSGTCVPRWRAKMLRAGMSREQVDELLLWNKLGTDDKESHSGKPSNRRVDRRCSRGF